jgi:hypothetical protein
VWGICCAEKMVGEWKQEQIRRGKVMTLSFIGCANESISLTVESARLYLYCDPLFNATGFSNSDLASTASG